MNKSFLFFFLFVVFSYSAYAFDNPAARYCIDHGYQSMIQIDADGNQNGVCVVDGQLKDEWEFYNQNYIKSDKDSENLTSIRLVSRDNLKKIIEIMPRVTSSKIVIEKEQGENEQRSAPLPIIDWRNYNGQNWVSPVKNQGGCGGCWAFSSVNVMESRAKIDLNNGSYGIDLSEQDVISYNTGVSNCSGGYESDAFNFAKDIGIVKESCMPYIQSSDASNICANWQNESMKISSFAKMSANADSIKQTIDDYGPVTVYLVVCDDFQAFSGSGIYAHNGDVYNDNSCWGVWPSSLNWHSVSIVGYNDTGQYWIIKNSWGSGWGDSGYIKIAYSQNIIDFSDWVDAVLNDPEGDSRVLFLDDSYYVTNTDISTLPTLNSAAANVTETRFNSNPITFSAYAMPHSIKLISDVTILGTPMSGNVSGGTFTFSNTPAFFGCQDIEGNCTLPIIVLDDAGKSASSEVSFSIDDQKPRIALVSPIASISTNNIEFKYNVSENPSYPSLNCSLYIDDIYNQSMTAAANAAIQSFDQINLGDGTYSWFVNCTDHFGNSNVSTTEIFTKDSIAPIFLYSNISHDSVIQGQSIYISSTWNYEINSLVSGLLYLDSILVLTNSTPSNGNYTGNVSFVYTTLDTQAGMNLTLKIKVNDTAGMVSSFSPSIVIRVNDTIPPYVNLISPINNAQKNQLLQTFEYNISDNVYWKLANCSLFINGIYNKSNASIPTNGTLQNFSVFFASEEGTINWNVTCIDSDGNIGSNADSFILDLNPPIINLISPTNMTWKNTQILKLSYNYTDQFSNNASCKLRINNINYINLINNNTIKEVTTDVLSKNTLYLWNVSCTDNAGNIKFSETRFVGVDIVPPVVFISLNNSPNSDGWLNKPTSINITAIDIPGSGLSYIQWKNASNEQWINISETFILNSNLSNNLIYARAFDNAGNYIGSEKQKVFKYDDIKPIIFSVVHPIHLTKSQSFLISAYVTDNLSQIKSVNYNLNSVNGSLSYSSGRYIGTAIAPNADGTYNLSITVSDKAENLITNITTIIVNSSLPTIAISRLDGDYIRNNTAVIITVGNTVKFWYNYTGHPAFVQTDQNSTTITVQGSEGPFKLMVWANSSANITRNQNYTFYIDETAPTVNLPLVNLSNIIGILSFVAIANDDSGSGLQSVSLYIDENINAYSTKTSGYNFAYPTTLLDDGLHKFIIKATDNVGLISSKTLIFNITNIESLVNLIVIGDIDISSGVITEDQFVNSSVEGVVNGIVGLNISTIIVGMVENLPHNPSSIQLSTVVGKINITASTETLSRVYILIPTQKLSDLGLSSPYPTIAFYADHGSAVTGPLDSEYDSSYQIDGIDYERFWFETNQYSLFFWGIQGSEDDDNSDDNTDGGGSGGGGGGGSDAPIIVPQTYQTTLISDGVIVSMLTRDNVVFSLGNIKHTLTVNSLSGVSASFILASSPQMFTLSLGDSKRFDMDKNGKTDLVVKLISIVNSTVSVLLKDNELLKPDPGLNLTITNSTEPATELNEQNILLVNNDTSIKLPIKLTEPTVAITSQSAEINDKQFPKLFKWLFFGAIILIVSLLILFFILNKKKSLINSIDKINN